MKTDIETLKESFWYGYDTYYESRLEADEAWNFYHNRQWTVEQLGLLENRGQPKETFNVVKLFARMMVGYYSTIVNRVRALPRQEQDSTIASVMTDVTNSIFDFNDMDTEGDNIKLSGIISGLMCIYEEPVYTGERDRFGRPLYEIKLQHVPDYELVLDPMSTAEDYSDGRYLHRFKWLSEDAVIEQFGKAKAEELVSYYNYLNVDEAEYSYSHADSYQGRYRVFDNYLITHTVIVDDDQRRWSIFWCGDVELRRDEITYRDVKWNYRVVKLHTSNTTEYYGVFREVMETQKAINQALIKLQLMVNTEKAFIETGAVDNIEEFTNAFNRVNGVIPVKKLAGVKVEQLSREALEQYAVIDRGLDRIQRILGINDSFLGQAYASDSGRKVKLQQNATILALRYLTIRIELFYKLLGEDVMKLVKQFYTAEQTLRVTDQIVGHRFVQLNKPLEIWTGEYDAQGNPIYQVEFEPVLNPDTQEPEETEEGNLVFAPIPEEDTEVNFTKFDITIETTTFNDEDERSQLMIENVLSSTAGQMLAQINPRGYFEATGLAIRTLKTKYTPEISQIFSQTAAMLGGNPAAEEGAAQIGSEIGDQQSQKSQDLKLPTNTNEN